jgi:hypothetical protein
MDLIAWWKLEENILDSSGNNYNGTNYGSTFPQGKIGKAASTNGVSTFFTTPSVIPDTKNRFSLSFWVYPVSTESDRRLIGVSSYGYDHSFRYDGANQRVGVEICLTNNTSQRQRYTADNSVPRGAWSHISLIMDDLRIKIYVNGILSGDFTETIDVAPWTGTWFWGQRGVSTFWFSGSVDDVRVYNGLMSQFEVQELYRAKILHYNFDDFQEPTTNIVLPSAQTFNPVYVWEVDGSGGLTQYAWVSGHGDAGSTVTDPMGNQARVFSVSDEGFLFFDFNSLTSGAPHTFSIYVRPNQDYTFRLRWDGLFVSQFAPANVWTRISNTKTFSATTNRALVGYRDADSAANPPAGFTVAYAMPQLEAKSYATEFTRTSRTGMVQDLSGYENNSNLVLATTPRWTSNSRIGSGAYRFDGVNDFIDTEIITSTPGSLTFSAWFRTSSTNLVSQFLFTNNRYGDGTTGNRGMELGPYSTGNTFRYALRLNDSWVDADIPGRYNDGNWHLATMVFNSGQNLKAYMDGQLIRTTSTTFTFTNSTFETLKIGGNPFTNTSFFDGEIDDARVYYNSLTDDEVFDLYANGANLDRSGNLFAREVAEDYEVREGLTLSQLFEDENLAVNPYFRDGVDPWSPIYHSQFLVEGGNLRVYNDGTVTASRIRQVPLTINSTDKYFVSFRSRSNVSHRLSVRYGFSTSTRAADQWEYLSGVTTFTQSSFLQIEFFSFGAADTSKWFELDGGHGVFVVNLTQAFGSGVEPTQAQMDAWLSDYNNFMVKKSGQAKSKSFSEADITNGLVAWYPLNGNTLDYEINGINGTNVGGTVTTGNDGNLSYNFSGSNQYINITGIPNFAGAVFSISFYIYPLGGQPGRIIGLYKNNRMGINDNGDGSLSYFVWSGGTVENNTVASAINYNQWQHFVWTSNGTIARLYKNGELLHTGTTRNSVEVNNIGDHIASNGWQANNFFKGRVSDVRFYNRFLSAQEIKLLYKLTGGSDSKMDTSRDGTTYVKGEVNEY